MRYQPITPADADFLCQLFSTPEYDLYFAENDTTAEDWRERIDEFFTDKQSLVISTDAGQPVGWIMFERSGSACELDIIALSPSQRGRGYGKQALTELMLSDPTVSTITLDVQKRNTRAIDFYRALGFQVIGEEMQPVGDGEQAYWKMRLEKKPQ